MHILVVNDDGPPSNQSSPYIHAFVQTLQKHHLVSVILPHQQRSWIGKAHFVGQLTKPTYFRPGTIHQDDGTTHPKPSSADEEAEEWILVDGTPATCTQLGLHHFFKDRPPIDLVVSGPNYGRNSTSLFSLSSGTIGGAMEAAVCQKKAIALSFAFYSRNHDPELIAGACRHSHKLIEHLYANWNSDVDLYSCNVPVIADVETHKTIFTHALQNYWTSGSSFDEVGATEENEDPETREQEIRESGETSSPKGQPTRHKHRHFKWAPKFGDVQKSIEASPPGNDGWALHQGYSSVTPLKANYMHSSEITLGEIKLLSEPSTASIPRFYAIIDADSYVLPLIRTALSKHFPPRTYSLIPHIDQLPHSASPLLQIRPYESLDFNHLLANPTTSLANSYIIRKALIRKHYLHNTITSWWSKHPSDENLKGHVPLTVAFEVDYAEFLDEALVECWELHESFEKEERQWWILKPGMSDQGQGLRLFSSEEELRAIFEEWEAEEAEAENEDEDNTNDNDKSSTDTPPAINGQDVIGAGTMTSQLRHFIAQRYIDPPLLLPSQQNRKFHIRSYVLAVGALRTYVYKEMLALFAPLPYTSPNATSSNPGLNPQIHLTNTCLHSTPSTPSPSNVTRFSSLPTHHPTLPPTWQTSVFAQICAATGTLFEAAAREQMIHFQTLENAFEVFGVDWMVDAGGGVWLLEVNAFPDFGQCGEGERGVVGGFWEGVVGVGVRGFFGRDSEGVGKQGKGGEEERWGMVKVLDIDLGRR